MAETNTDFDGTFDPHAPPVQRVKGRYGFASMDPEKQREIARLGGLASHEKGTAHEWTSEEARGAGRKGGAVMAARPGHMAMIGRKGGLK